jgi:WD40 repeat protein
VIWSVETGDVVNTLDSPPLHDVVFVNEQTVAFGGASGKAVVVLYDVDTWTEIGALTDRAAPWYYVKKIAASPDGCHVFTGHVDGGIAIWDVKEHRLIKKLRAHGDRITSLSVAADGKTLVTGSDANSLICVWNLICGELVTSWTVPDSGGKVSISPDASALLTGGRTSTRIWRADADAEPKPTYP